MAIMMVAQGATIHASVELTSMSYDGYTTKLAFLQALPSGPRALFRTLGLTLKIEGQRITVDCPDDESKEIMEGCRAEIERAVPAGYSLDILANQERPHH